MAFYQVVISTSYQAVMGKSEIGTQNVMETQQGKITMCAGNLIIPKSVCVGTNKNDTIVSSPEGGTVFGKAGDDKIQGLLGGEVTFGNDGDDTIKSGNGSATVFGNNGNDILVGSGGLNIIYGEGTNMLFGGKGDDQLVGGPYHDVMVGDDGHDIFVCNDKQDVVTDFNEDEDKISGNCVTLWWFHIFV